MTIIEPDVQLAPTAGVFNQLVECVCEELATTGAGPTCWCGLYPGEVVPWDWCGAECDNDHCGMGWVRVVGVAPYDTFGIPTMDTTCALPLGWQIEVGALRCMPVSEDPPSPEMTGDVAMLQHADAYALYKAIKCCQLDSPGEFAVVQYVPFGPDGGCVGGAWLAFATVD